MTRAFMTGQMKTAPLALSCAFDGAVSHSAFKHSLTREGVIHLPADSFPAFSPDKSLDQMQSQINRRCHTARRHYVAFVHNPSVNHLRAKSFQFSKSIRVRRRSPPLKESRRA